MRKIGEAGAKLLIIVMVTFFTFIFVHSSAQAKPISQLSGGRFGFDTQGWMTEIKPQVATRKHAHASYTTYMYKKGPASFSLTLASMQNGDTVFFAHLESSKNDQPVILRLTVNDPDVSRVTSVANGTIQPQDKPKDGGTVNLPLYVDGAKVHYRIGPAAAFHPLGSSVYKKMNRTDLAAKVSKSKKGYIYEWKLPARKGQVIETWGMLSQNKLINWDNKDVVHRLESVSFDSGKVLRVDGAYYPNEETYRPYEPNSVYYNPANLDGLRSIAYLSNKDNGSYFDDLATHLAYASLQNQTAKGYWETQPLSAWLNTDYNLQAPYMDDRRNADNATFLQYYIRFKSDEEINQALYRWDRYIVSYILSSSVYPKGGGLLVPDYRDNDGRTTHIALNHHIALTNYLFERYLSTENTALKSLAEQMVKGVESTRDLWVKPNDDLYYSISQRLQPIPGFDYRELTRDDLVETQRLLNKVEGEPSPALQALIDSKNKWLTGKNQNGSR